MQRWHEAITIEHLLDYSIDLESIVYSHLEDTGNRSRTVSAGTKQRNVAGQAALLEEVLRLFCLRIRGCSDIFILIITIHGVILVERRLYTPSWLLLGPHRLTFHPITSIIIVVWRTGRPEDRKGYHPQQHSLTNDRLFPAPS